MKKFILAILVFSIATIQLNSKKITAKTDPKAYTIYAMSTTFVVNLYDEGKEEDYDHIHDIFDYYYQLGSNFDRNAVLPGSKYYGLVNVYVINESRGTAVKVNQDLFDLVSFSIAMMEETNGYFNPLIGEAIDTWKSVIALFPKGEMTEEVHRVTLEYLNNKPRVTKDDIELNESELTITLKGDAKLDLGAIGKGYAVQKAYEYILSKGYTYFYISGGHSSSVYGTHPEKRPFVVGLTDGHDLYQTDYYAYFNAQNSHVVTSGDYIQYSTYQGNIYHHIIDPKTYLPPNHYHTVTIVGQDGGRLDAYSTAVYNMEPEVAKAFLKEKGLVYSFYRQDGVDTNINGITINKKNATFNSVLVLSLILGGVVVVFGSIIAYLMIKEKKNHIKEHNHE